MNNHYVSLPVQDVKQREAEGGERTKSDQLSREERHFRRQLTSPSWSRINFLGFSFSDVYRRLVTHAPRDTRKYFFFSFRVWLSLPPLHLIGPNRPRRLSPNCHLLSVPGCSKQKDGRDRARRRGELTLSYINEIPDVRLSVVLSILEM